MKEQYKQGFKEIKKEIEYLESCGILQCKEISQNLKNALIHLRHQIEDFFNIPN